MTRWVLRIRLCIKSLVNPSYEQQIMLSCLVKRVSKDNYIKVVGREATLIAKINDDMEKYEEKKTNRIIRICLKLACKLTVALKSVQPAFAST